MTAPAAPKRRPRLARKDQLLVLDYAFLSLAFLSAAFVILTYTLKFDLAARQAVVYIDDAAVVLFALGFVARAFTWRNKLRFLRAHAIDILAFFPLTQTLFWPERWFPIVQVLIVVSRFSASLDRAFGDRVFARVVDHYRDALVDLLADPILLRIVEAFRGNLVHTDWVRTIGKSLYARKPQLLEAARKSLDSSPKIQLLRKIPGASDAIDDTVDEMVTAAILALTSEEVNRAIAESIDRALKDFEKNIQEKSDRRGKAGLGTVARELVS
ncbi:MAG: hypothetical protein ACYDCK_10580 [Thermoplasmatota archaeon]